MELALPRGGITAAPLPVPSPSSRLCCPIGTPAPPPLTPPTGINIPVHGPGKGSTYSSNIEGKDRGRFDAGEGEDGEEEGCGWEKKDGFWSPPHHEDTLKLCARIPSQLHLVALGAASARDQQGWSRRCGGFCLPVLGGCLTPRPPQLTWCPAEQENQLEVVRDPADAADAPACEAVLLQGQQGSGGVPAAPELHPAVQELGAGHWCQPGSAGCRDPVLAPRLTVQQLSTSSRYRMKMIFPSRPTSFLPTY